MSRNEQGIWESEEESFKKIKERADLNSQQKKELMQEKFMYDVTKEMKSIKSNIQFFFYYFLIANLIYLFNFWLSIVNK